MAFYRVLTPTLANVVRRLPVLAAFNSQRNGTRYNVDPDNMVQSYPLGDDFEDAEDDDVPPAAALDVLDVSSAADACQVPSD